MKKRISLAHKCWYGFREIKQRITEAPVMRLLEFSKVFEVACDASGIGIGRVSSQKKNTPSPILVKSLVVLKLNYSTYDKKFYAVVQSLRHWRHYLLTQEFIIYSNHEAFDILILRSSVLSIIND